MENFENKLLIVQKVLENIRGIFDKNKIELKLKDLEEINQKENFWKDKQLVKKTVKQKKVSGYSTRLQRCVKRFS